MVGRCEPALGGAAILRSGYFVSEGNHERILLAKQIGKEIDIE